MTIKLLLETPLRTRRQIARVRLQAKQIARLLGFGLLQQMEIACRTFALALQAAKRGQKRHLRFELAQDRLYIRFQIEEAEEATSGLCYVLEKAPEFCAEDVVWMASQLNSLLRLDVLEVIREQDEEISRLIEALRCCHSDLERLGQGVAKPSAA